MKRIVEKAYAKINLTLDVLAKRPDGYHEVEMIMQSISLADTLTFYEADTISLNCDNPLLPTNDNNLAIKAAKAILDGTGKGVMINLEKRIPLEAGMAGGSSDAAAVLRGLNDLYQLSKTEEELKAIAVTLGADVPFCISGGTALARGIGEQLTKLPSVPILWLVLIKPSFGVSTASVYKALNLNDISVHPQTNNVIDAIRIGNRSGIINGLYNVLEEVTLKIRPELINIKQQLIALGAKNVLMSGSGPTIFGVFQDKAQAEHAAYNFPKEGIDVFVAHTLSES